MLSNRNKEPGKTESCLFWLRRGRERICCSLLTSSFKAAADCQVLRSCLSLGFEGLLHGSFHLVPKKELISAAALINKPKVHALALQTSSGLLLGCKGWRGTERQQTGNLAPAFIFQAFYEAKKTGSPMQEDLLPLYFRRREQYNALLC